MSDAGLAVGLCSGGAVPVVQAFGLGAGQRSLGLVGVDVLESGVACGLVRFGAHGREFEPVVSGAGQVGAAT